MNIAIGDKEIDFVFQGDRLIYPSYAGAENMVLHYDFSGMKNNDVTRAVAKDLSGNGNNGALNNFEYVEESGYKGDGLVFDGVDDYVQGSVELSFSRSSSFTFEFSIDYHVYENRYIGTFGRHSQSIRLNTGGSLVVSYLIDIEGAFSVGNAVLSINNKEPRISLFALVFDTESLKISLYENGVFVSHENLNPSMGNTAQLGRVALGALVSPTGIMETSKISFKTFRKYTRALTPAEIQTNYQIDKQRFNLP